MCLCDGYTIQYFDYHCFNNSVKNNVRQKLDNMKNPDVSRGKFSKFVVCYIILEIYGCHGREY
jgi:hypothetical protein